MRSTGTDRMSKFVNIYLGSIRSIQNYIMDLTLCSVLWVTNSQHKRPVRDFIKTARNQARQRPPCRRFQRAGDQSATSNLPASLSYNESTMKRCTHELNREVQAICSGSCCFVWLLRLFRMLNPPIVGSMLLDTCCWLVVRQSSRCSYSDCRSESYLCTYVEEAAMH